MKKIFLAVIFLSGFSVYVQAQSTPVKAKKPATAATASAAPKASAAVTPTKKDGTPDMRYKSNKDAAKAAPATTHTKKDGTPDKRYKENKK